MQVSTESEIPLWVVLYLYIRTPRNKYMYDAEYLDRLIKWLEPIRLPTYIIKGNFALKPLHFITIPNLQRYLANRLNTNVETIHYCLKYHVYPRLGDSYEF